MNHGASQMPNVLHPTTFSIGGIHIRVVSYMTLTDEQAGKIARMTHRMRKWTKADQKKVHTQYWTGDEQALHQLG